MFVEEHVIISRVNVNRGDSIMRRPSGPSASSTKRAAGDGRLHLSGRRIFFKTIIKLIYHQLEVGFQLIFMETEVAPFEELFFFFIKKKKTLDCDP